MPDQPVPDQPESPREPDRLAAPTEPTEPREHPVLAGLAALLGVAIVVGAILGGGALVVTQALGVGDDDTADASASSSQTLFLPDPTDTGGEDEPYITLSSSPTAAAPTKTATEKPKDAEPITLSAGQTAVSAMGRIDLTGVYPGGEGAILSVQQFENGSWSDFPVTASVSGETFATYIQTGQLGLNRFRMIDTDTGAISNEVRVDIS